MEPETRDTGAGSKFGRRAEIIRSYTRDNNVVDLPCRDDLPLLPQLRALLDRSSPTQA